jgi:CspA family cold shock protein
MPNRQKGTTQWFDDAKGFGFIIPDSGGDPFVHSKAFEKDGTRIIAEGGRVKIQGPKDVRAGHVRPEP